MMGRPTLSPRSVSEPESEASSSQESARDCFLWKAGEDLEG